MAEGVILKSGSHDPAGEEGRQEKLDAVLENAGYEAVESEGTAEAEGEVPAGAEVEAAAETFPAPRTKAASRRERAIRRATAPLLERIKQLEAGQPRAAQAEAVATQSKPQRVDFTNDEAFEDALVRWGIAQATQQQHGAEVLRNYDSQVRVAKQAHPDWDALKQKFDANDVFIGHATQLAILEDEAGAEVTYYLMRHPEYAAELGRKARVSEISAVKEVARLSARLSGVSSGERSRPRVPAPVRTVSTAGSGAVSTPADVAARPNYPGKAKDFRRALAER